MIIMEEEESSNTVDIHGSRSEKKTAITTNSFTEHTCTEHCRLLAKLLDTDSLIIVIIIGIITRQGLPRESIDEI